MSAAVAAPKVKKASKVKSKAPAAHPPYADMIRQAVKELKERNGSSRQAVIKYIRAHFKVDEKVDSHVRRGLVSGVKAGKLIHTKGSGASGSFKLADKSSGNSSAKPVKAASKARKPRTPKKAKKPAAAKKSTAVAASGDSAAKPAPAKAKTASKAKKSKTPKKPKAAKPKSSARKPAKKSKAKAK